MTIGPVSNSHREISVTEPVSPALERVKTMLFKPFDLGKWFAIGFCAWLALLGEGGGGGGFNNGVNFDNRNPSAESFRHGYHQARNYVLENLAWIVPTVAAVVILMLALWLLILWLSSRGKFMFLHCVALDKAEVSVPWSKFGHEADSLFWFRAALGFLSMFLLLPPIGFAAALVLRMIIHGEVNIPGVMVAVGLCLLFFLVAIVFALIQKVTHDFVVPIMFLRRCKCLAAWKEFRGLLASHAGLFTLYILFQIVLGMAISILVLAAIIITCCIACCLMLIPYIGTVVLLPVLVFKQSYPLYFLRQFGADFDVFGIESPAPPMTGLPSQPDMP
jgi:hypothetical protein